MKKNVMLKIAAVVMVAVLLSTCAISTTLAKYSTTSEAKQIGAARVAKWGVAVDAAATQMFSETYGDTTQVTNNVIASEVVVAPGSEGTHSISGLISGTPEVSGKVTYKLKVTYTNFGDYKPLVFTYNDGKALAITSGQWVELTDAAYSFKAGTDLSTATAVTVEWEWPFDANDTADNELVKSIDDDDDTNDPVVTVEIQIVVEQTGAAGAHQ